MLDTLVVQLKGNATEHNLALIDQALRLAGPDLEPGLAYYLHRYRCEQLYYQGLFDASMIDAAKARRIAEELKDSLLIASSMNQVAVLLEEQRDDEQAIALLRAALRWYPVAPVSAYPITQPHRIHGNLGRCWANIGVLDSARVCQERSLRLAEQAQVPRGAALALLELGRLHMRAQDADGALVLFDRAIALADTNAIHDVLLDGLADKAEALVRMARTDQARQAFDSGHTLIHAHPEVAPRSVLAFHDREVELLAEVGLFREALTIARTWRTLDSALRASSARTAQRTLAALHATDAELVQERSRAERAAAELEAELHIRRTIQVGSALALLLLAALVIIYIGRARQKDRLQRLALQRSEQDRQIADLRIRQQVAADLHDDLGAGLSALKLHSELAEELSAPASRGRSHTLSHIAGELIAGMRHILWSLNHTDATIAETATYIADRTRAYCAEQGRSIRINAPAAWPLVVPDAELRHLPWIVIKDLLNVAMEQGIVPDLSLSWRDGLVLAFDQPAEPSAATRAACASTLSAHHLRISRLGGSLRMHTEGPLRVEIFLPHRPEPSKSPASVTALTVTLMLLGVFTGSVAPAQDVPLYHHPILDSLFTPVAMHAPSSVRLQAINAAIERFDQANEPKLGCHLFLSRANQMYYQGLYDVGIADVNRSLTLAQQLQDSLLIATTYNMFGLLYENLGNDAVTLPWFKLAGQWLPRDTRSRYPVVKDYHVDGNIAQCLLNLGRTDSAQAHFERSQRAAQAAGNMRALALANLGLAKVALERNALPDAAALLDSARAQAQRDGSNDVHVDVFPVLAELRMLRSSASEGARTLDEAVVFLRSDSTITPVSRRNFFKHASVLWERLGRYEEAMSAWRAWQREDSTIQNQDDRAAMSTLRIMLDNDQRLKNERAEREQVQAQLLLDRERRQVTITAAAITAILLLSVLLLYAGRRRNLRRLAVLELERSQRRSELDELRVRQRLSDEMHEALGAGLEALKLRSELAYEVEPDVLGRERLKHITAQASELIGSLRQIIWALDTGRSSLQETVLYTVHYARTYAAQQGLTIHLHVDANWPDRQLVMEQRRNCFLVVKEALHNVVKHAHATDVELRMTLKDGLLVEIADNGRGIQPSGPNRSGNGLRNMRKRIDAIGGQLDMEWSQGTVVRFTIPLTLGQDNVRSTLHTLA